MVRAPSTSLGMGYVPDGLTPEQYKKIQAEKEAQIKASKTKKRGYAFIPFSCHLPARLSLCFGHICFTVHSNATRVLILITLVQNFCIGRRPKLSLCSRVPLPVVSETESFLSPRSVAPPSSVEDLTDFNRRQEKLNPNKPDAGHVFVKIKGKGKEGTTQSGLDWFGNKKK